MAEYIEREVLLEKMKNWHEKISLVTCVNSIPAADVVPVRHGKWVNKGDYAVCTECGERSGTQYDGVEPIPLMTKLCPSCGAKMDGRID